MKAKDFYRILSQVKGMEWELLPHPKPSAGVPATTSFIRGRRHYFYYSPITAVASAVKRDFVDRSNKGINKILRLHPRTYERLVDAAYQVDGYSKTVRRKLLRMCRLPTAWA